MYVLLNDKYGFLHIAIDPHLLKKSNRLGLSPYDVINDYAFKQQMEEVYCHGSHLSSMYLSTVPHPSSPLLPIVNCHSSTSVPEKRNTRSRMYLPL